MARHLNSVMWGLRRLRGSAPNVSEGYVKTLDEKNIIVVYRYGLGYGWQELSMSRKDARLMAKRILQCLEETK